MSEYLLNKLIKRNIYINIHGVYREKLYFIQFVWLSFMAYQTL